MLNHTAGLYMVLSNGTITLFGSNYILALYILSKLQFIDITTDYFLKLNCCQDSTADELFVPFFNCSCLLPSSLYIAVQCTLSLCRQNTNPDIDDPL